MFNMLEVEAVRTEILRCLWAKFVWKRDAIGAPPHCGTRLLELPRFLDGAHAATATVSGIGVARRIVGLHTVTFIRHPTATAVGGAIMSLLRALVHALYRICCRSTRGRFRLIGAALHVGPRAAAGQHRTRGLGQGRRARLGGRGRKNARPWHTRLKFMKQ